MKSYTDIEQSKKLAKILPIESADMYYFVADSLEKQEINYAIRCGTPIVKTDIPSWSLAALLDIIPKRIKKYNVLRTDISEDFAIWYDEVGYGVNNELPVVTKEYAVDACYEMILKLHGLNLL